MNKEQGAIGQVEKYYPVLGIADCPGLLSVSHGSKEYVKIEEIFKCALIYALTALDILLN